MQGAGCPDYPTCRVETFRRHPLAWPLLSTVGMQATVETVVAFALIFATMSRIFVSPKS